MRVPCGVLWFCLAALALTIEALPVCAQEPEPSLPDVVLRAEAQPTVMTIGDDVTCTVHLDYAGTIESVTGLRESALMLGQFEIKQYSWQNQPALKEGRFIIEDTYRISTYVTGDYEIPAFTAHYRRKDGTTGIVSTQPIKIKVNSVLTSESDAEDIQDIAMPVSVGKPGLTREARVTLAVICVAILLLIVGILALFRGRKPVPPPPPRPAHDIALERFALLRKGELLLSGREKEFAGAASDILREYLNNRYGLEARDMTTGEIDRRLRFEPETESHADSFVRYLEFCDRIKFAKYIPGSEEKESLLNNGEELVRVTMQRPEPVSSPAETTETTPPEVVKEEPELAGVGAGEEKAP